MKKYVIIVLGVILAYTGLWFAGRKQVTGCCQIGETRCASGQGVTRDYCEQKLDGQFCADKLCNTDTGQCE